MALTHVQELRRAEWDAAWEAMVAAGKRWFDSLNATDQETEEQAELLAESLADEKPQDFTGYGWWDGMLADQVQDARDWNEEEAASGDQTQTK